MFSRRKKTPLRESLSILISEMSSSDLAPDQWVELVADAEPKAVKSRKRSGGRAKTSTSGTTPRKKKVQAPQAETVEVVAAEEVAEVVKPRRKRTPKPVAVPETVEAVTAEPEAVAAVEEVAEVVKPRRKRTPKPVAASETVQSEAAVESVVEEVAEVSASDVVSLDVIDLPAEDIAVDTNPEVAEPELVEVAASESVSGGVIEGEDLPEVTDQEVSTPRRSWLFGRRHNRTETTQAASMMDASDAAAEMNEVAVHEEHAIEAVEESPVEPISRRDRKRSQAVAVIVAEAENLDDEEIEPIVKTATVIDDTVPFDGTIDTPRRGLFGLFRGSKKEKNSSDKKEATVEEILNIAPQVAAPISSSTEAGDSGSPFALEPVSLDQIKDRGDSFDIQTPVNVTAHAAGEDSDDKSEVARLLDRMPEPVRQATAAELNGFTDSTPTGLEGAESVIERISSARPVSTPAFRPVASSTPLPSAAYGASDSPEEENPVDLSAFDPSKYFGLSLEARTVGTGKEAREEAAKATEEQASAEETLEANGISANGRDSRVVLQMLRELSQLRSNTPPQQ